MTQTVPGTESISAADRKKATRAPSGDSAGASSATAV
jgi:hypothetical protein